MKDKNQTMQKKIYNLNKERKVQLVIFGIVIICVGLLLMKYVKSEDCTVEEYTLISQELKFNSVECVTMPCLFIEVEDEFGERSVQYYSSDMQLLNQSFGISNGDKMKVKWCNIEGIGKRVRGIAKS